MKLLPKAMLAASMGVFVATGVITAFQTAQPAFAAEKKKEEHKRETRHLLSLSQAVYDLVNKANKALQANMYDEAIKLADEVLKRRGLNAYEQCIAYQMRGYAEVNRGGKADIKAAISDFEKLVMVGSKSEGLPDGMVDGTRFNLASLYMQESEYDKGIALLKAWLKTADNPSAQAYILLANGYAQKDDYKSAIPQYLKAMEIDKAQNKEIPKDWYQNLAGMYLATMQYKKAEPILELLVSKWPTKAYLMNLANVYGMQKREKDMLAIVDALYRIGKIDKGDEIKQLSDLWQYHNAPYRGAVILKKGMDDGLVKKDADNYRSLANAYIASDEVKKAIPYLEKGAAMSKDGNLYIRLGEALIDSEKWQQAQDALQAGLKKGGVDNKNQAIYLVGITQYNLGKLNDAKRSFANCMDDKHIGANCKSYLNVIRNKQKSESD